MKRRTGLVEELTPREWEVLALVREGLTNEQIASRLGISRDGVKYHVSEILGKLGMEDRIEAARWYDRQTRQRAGLFGWFGGLFRRSGESAQPAAQAIAVGAIVVAAVGLIALLAGVLVMQSRSTAQPEALPDDRSTGDPRLDEVLAALVNGDADDARQNALASAIAREYDPLADDEKTFQPSEWSGRLASSTSRELYAVLLAPVGVPPEHDFEAHLRVVAPDGKTEGWQVMVNDYEVVYLRIDRDPSWLALTLGRQYEMFVVLPPAADLPKPPETHSADVRSGDPEVDAILDALDHRNSGAVLSLVDFGPVPCGSEPAPPCGGQPAGTPVDVIGVMNCGGYERRYEGRAFVEKRLASITGRLLGVVGIAEVPNGYLPWGERMVILLGEESPCAWQSDGLLVSDGRITGFINDCSDRPELLYPPAAFVVSPPDDLQSLDPSRRSGIGVIDAFLDALAADDMNAMDALTSYDSIGCVTGQPGIGSPPSCDDGETEGTLLQVIITTQCEGGYVRRRDHLNLVLPRLAEPEWSLYAVLDRGPLLPGQDDFRRGRYQVILHDEAQPRFERSRSLSFDDLGLTMLSSGCSTTHPLEMYWPGRSPGWLLAPP